MNNFIRTLAIGAISTSCCISQAYLNYYNGKSFYGKVDLDGNPIKRPVKSVVMVQEKGIGG
ncbi:hypothetical protein [Scytonema sp. PRP1]|uniref:hypothetical protein n=1 Tax=Scytonema sp. PRP1 TaxID=3120513 RepID=UPI002FD3BC29